MVRAWYMDDSNEDQRSEHHRNPPKYVDMDTVKNTTGVLYWKLNPETYETDGTMDQIRKDRGYSYKDQIECTPEKLENYNEKLKIFYREHLHTDEEIRFVEKGSGYFDVRDCNEEWIRILVEPGDLIVLPAGIYHRFTLDSNDYIKCVRLFVGEPVWTAHNRGDDGVDKMDAREQYLKQVKAN